MDWWRWGGNGGLPEVGGAGGDAAVIRRRHGGAVCVIKPIRNVMVGRTCVFIYIK